MSENENITVESDEPTDGDGVNVDSAEASESPGGDGELSDIEKLEQQLEQALNDSATAREEMLRARAEAENIRKRAERDVAAAHKYGLERFINQILPVKDSMDLGFDALETTSDVDAIREGMELTRKMFDDVLEKSGVGVIDPVGEVFNPEFHQAMTMQPSTEVAAGTVLSVMQKGYTLNERLIRPAMVVVAKAADEGDA